MLYHIAFSTNNRMRYNIGNRRGNGNQRGDGNQRNGNSHVNKGKNGSQNEAENVSVLRSRTEGSGEKLDIYNAHNVMLKMNPLELIIDDYDEDYERDELEDKFQDGNINNQSSPTPTTGPTGENITITTRRTTTRTTSTTETATTRTIEDKEQLQEQLQQLKLQQLG